MSLFLKATAEVVSAAGHLLSRSQTYGVSLSHVWHWTNSLERLVLVLLALMLVRVIGIVASVLYLQRLARHRTGTDGAQRKLAAELRLKLRNLRSILASSPYLGSVGAFIGILSIFRGYDGTSLGVVVMAVSRIEAAFLSSAAGMLVAVPTICFYNHLVRCIDSLEKDVANGSQSRAKFPLRATFSTFPFAVIAATALVISAAMFMVFPSFHQPKGLPVRLLKIGVIETEHLVKPIVIQVAAAKPKGASDIYVNSQTTPWDELEDRLQSQLKVRPPWSLAYVEAEREVSWQDVMRVIDVAERLHADVVLLTNNMSNVSVSIPDSCAECKRGQQVH